MVMLLSVCLNILFVGESRISKGTVLCNLSTAASEQEFVS